MMRAAKHVAVAGALAVAVASCNRAAEKPTLKDVAVLQGAGEPVKFEALEGFLPGTDAVATAGWDKTDMTGTALSVPMKGSQASMTLKKGDSAVVVDIVDTVFNQSLYAPVAAYLASGFSSSDGNGYKKAVSIGGQPAFEEWNRKDHTGGVTILVGKRFLVHVLGTGIANIEPVTFVAGQIDLARLAALK